MDIAYFCMNKRKLREDVFSTFDVLQKILDDCGFMWFHVNSPGVFLNACVFFKLCIFITSPKKNSSLFVPPAEVYICLLFHDKLSFLKIYRLPDFTDNEINEHFVGLVAV